VKFAPNFHTKSYLLENLGCLFQLVSGSEDFAMSDLAQDLDFISHKLIGGDTVAHALAERQPMWVNTAAAKNYSVIKLHNSQGWSVAHFLAEHQPSWVFSDAAKDYEVLKIANKDGWSVAHKISVFQSEWLNSSASQDLSILMLSSSSGVSIAHSLAQHQPNWVHSDDAKNEVILKLTNYEGRSVAHNLARYQPEWILSDAAKNYDILNLANQDGWTVAHSLAYYQKNWSQNDASSDFEILKIINKSGWSVAHAFVVHQKNCADFPAFSDKRVLTIDDGDSLVAECVIRKDEKYADNLVLNVTSMALKLISQGAAYKHSEILPVSVGESLLDQANNLIEDSTDALISLKYGLALYSTIFHCVEKNKNLAAHDLFQALDQPWQNILAKTEVNITKIFEDNPNLWNVEHTVDFLCEPADNLIRRLEAANTLGQVRIGELTHGESIAELTAKNGLF
jgi:hypothetical protein